MFNYWLNFCGWNVWYAMVVCNEIKAAVFIWIAGFFFDRIPNEIQRQRGMVYVR